MSTTLLWISIYSKLDYRCIEFRGDLMSQISVSDKEYVPVLRGLFAKVEAEYKHSPIAIDIETTGLDPDAMVTLASGAQERAFIVSVACAFRKNAFDVTTVVCWHPSVMTIIDLMYFLDKKNTVAHYTKFEEEWLSNITGRKISIDYDTCSLAWKHSECRNELGKVDGKLKHNVKYYFNDDYELSPLDDIDINHLELVHGKKQKDKLLEYNSKDALYTLLLWERWIHESEHASKVEEPVVQTASVLTQTPVPVKTQSSSSADKKIERLDKKQKAALTRKKILTPPLLQKYWEYAHRPGISVSAKVIHSTLTIILYILLYSVYLVVMVLAAAVILGLASIALLFIMGNSTSNGKRKPKKA